MDALHTGPLPDPDDVYSMLDPEFVPIEDLLIAHETEGLDDEDTLRLFARLIRSGLAWNLQGHYGRTAAGLIEAGWIDGEGNLTQRARDRMVAADVFVSRAFLSEPEHVLQSAVQRLLYGTTTDDLPRPSTIQVLVDEVAARVGLDGPIPTVALMTGATAPTAGLAAEDPNAPEIAFTPTLLRLLTKDELRGVIAHELGHLEDYGVSTHAREYAADLFAREHGYGDDLARALTKIVGDSLGYGHTNLTGDSTHPPMDERVRRLTATTTGV